MCVPDIEYQCHYQGSLAPEYRNVLRTPGKTSTRPVKCAYAQIVVEYDPADVDFFISIADAIEDRYPGLMVEGEEKESSSADSPLFEVRAEDGRELFSARQKGHLPDSDEVLDLLAAAGVSDS